jgi:hypothetical protein
MSEKRRKIRETNSHARWRFNQKIARPHQVVTRGGVFILNVKSATFEFAWYSWLQKTNGNCHNKIGIFLQLLHTRDRLELWPKFNDI